MMDPAATIPRTLYVSDLDGTLLRSDSTIGADSARLLSGAIRQGALFTYATARSFSSSRRATRALPLTLPVITYGGTITVHPDTGDEQGVHHLAESAVEAVLEACATEPHAEPILHTFEVGRDEIRWRPEQMTDGVTVFLAARPRDPRLRPVTAIDPLDPSTVFYISVLADRETLLRLRSSLQDRLPAEAHFVSTDTSTPGLDWFEIHSAEGTKARAVERLMADLRADRLVVFGDNENDLPLFDIADEAYAVANAIPAVRAAATSVIEHHDTDAVARWIAADLRERGAPAR